MSSNVAFTLIFSAKESLFKALYPHVGDYFDFSAAEVVEINGNVGHFTIKLAQQLTSALKEGMTFKGYFDINADDVTTYIVE